MIFPSEDYWTAADAVYARDFFKSSTGQKALALLDLNRPKIDGQTRDDRYDKSLERQAWENARNFLAGLTMAQDQAQEDNLHQIDTSSNTSRKITPEQA